MCALDRRSVVASLALAPLIANTKEVKQSAQEQKAATTWPSEPIEWLRVAATTKGVESPLHLGRFRDPMYWLLDPLQWSELPAPGVAVSGASPSTTLTVPRGFVTDLASIPPLFFTYLRPDGEYASAAIVHDYLYWAQITTREYADACIKKAMQDLEVRPDKIDVIYEGVRRFGQNAWNKNCELKKKGEKRVLVKFPDKANINWVDWKGQRDAFGDL
jgi:hypothetical protein